MSDEPVDVIIADLRARGARVRRTSAAKSITGASVPVVSHSPRSLIDEATAWAVRTGLQSYVVLEPDQSPAEPPLARVNVRLTPKRIEVIAGLSERDGATMWRGSCAEPETPGFSRVTLAMHGLALTPRGRCPVVTIDHGKPGNWLQQLRDAGLIIWRVL